LPAARGEKDIDGILVSAAPGTASPVVVPRSKQASMQN